MIRRTRTATAAHAAKMQRKKAARAAPNYPYGMPARGKRYPAVGEKQRAKGLARLPAPEALHADPVTAKAMEEL